MDYKNKITLSIMIFLAVTASMIYFVIIPEQNKIIQISNETATQNQQIENNYSQGQSLKKFAENLKTVEPRIDEIKQIFTKEDDAFNYISELEKIAESCNLTIKSNLGAKKALSPTYSQRPLEIQIRGNFQGVMKFLSSLESQKKYINIKSMQISAVNPDINALPNAPVAEKLLVVQLSADSFWEN